jgi:hypothetical protein
VYCRPSNESRQKDGDDHTKIEANRERPMQGKQQAANLVVWPKGNSHRMSINVKPVTLRHRRRGNHAEIPHAQKSWCFCGLLPRKKNFFAKTFGLVALSPPHPVSRKTAGNFRLDLLGSGNYSHNNIPPVLCDGYPRSECM